MPRGKYPRTPKGNEVQPGVSVDRGVTTVQPGATVEMGPFVLDARKDMLCRCENGHTWMGPQGWTVCPLCEGLKALAAQRSDIPRACSRCVAFEPDDVQYGLCRLYPQAVRQRAEGWCLQFQEKP